MSIRKAGDFRDKKSLRRLHCRRRFTALGESSDQLLTLRLNVNGTVSQVVTGPLGITPGEYCECITASITAELNNSLLLRRILARMGLP